MLFYYYGDSMKNKDIMYRFIKYIEDNKLLTKFIMNIFHYDNLHDYNYIFRMLETEEYIIIDIYDNVSVNRFNRYVYDFSGTDYDVIDINDDGMFVKKIGVLNMSDSDDNILKLGYMFSLGYDLMIVYSSSFLDNVFVEIIKDIIK